MFSRFLSPSVETVFAVLSVLSVASCGPAVNQNILPRTPAAGIDLKTLAPELSRTTEILLPGSDEFTKHTVRWSNLEPPTPNVVIVPGTEKDVAKIVRSFDVIREPWIDFAPLGQIRLQA
jgi:hypothetical protein